MKPGGGRHFGLRAAMVLATMLAVTSCARPGPREIAQSYLQALKTGSYAQCYAALSPRERAQLPLDKFVAQIPLAPDVTRAWFTPLQGATDYQVETPRIDGATAVVPVEVSMPNLALWQRQLDGLRAETRAATIARQLRDRTYPRLVYTDEIVLVKEHHRWWLSGGGAVRDRIEALREKAIAAYHTYDFRTAVATYRQLLALLSESPFSGSDGLMTRFGRELMIAEASLRDEPQRRAYLSRLVIDKISRQPTSTSQPGIFGELHNTGLRSIDQLQLRVSYYTNIDGRPQAVYFEDHTALARPVEFGDLYPTTAALRPGGVLRFGFPLKAPAEIQSHSKAVVTADAVIFSNASVVPPKMAGYVPPRATPVRRPLAANATAATTATPAAQSRHNRTAAHRHHLKHHHDRHSQ